MLVRASEFSSRQVLSRPIRIGVLIAVHWLFVQSLCAQGSRIERLMEGINTLPVQFLPTKDGQVYALGIAKFTSGKFVGYCDLPASIDIFRRGPRPPLYEVEFAWGKFGGVDGYLVTGTSWHQDFVPEPFFASINNTSAITRYFADGRPPMEKLGPFLVLGVTVSGGGAMPTDEGSVKAWLKNYPSGAVFLLAPFDTVEQAQSFLKAMPPLSVD